MYRAATNVKLLASLRSYHILDSVLERDGQAFWAFFIKPESKGTPFY